MEGCVAKTKDIYQVVSAVKDLDKTMENWFKYVEFNTDSIKYYVKDEDGREGVEIKGLYKGQEISYRVKAVRFDFGGVDLMLVEPLNKEGGDPYSDYIKAYGNGFHHISVGVENFEEAIQKYEELGYKPWAESSCDGERHAIYDMQEVMGPVIEFTEKEVGPLGPRDENGKTI